MIQYYSIFIFIIIASPLLSQLEWQEHLSHDRRAYSHQGHFVLDGEIVLVMGNERPPMNTLERIKGNTTKERDYISNNYTFQAKLTRTGLDSKEVLLTHPNDYDIGGFGAYSIHEIDDNFHFRNIQGVIHPDLIEEYLYVEDAHLLGGPLDPKECLTNGKIYYLSADDNILSNIDIDGFFAYHEGLNGETYQISNGIFKNLSLPLNGSIDLGTYNDIINDPFKNQVIVRKENVLNRYSYEDLTFSKADILMNSPLDIQFIQNGFYYLTESDESYSVFFFSGKGSDSELFYELPKIDEVVDFKIESIEVLGDDIYFFGLRKSPFNNCQFSYVQKRPLNKDFNPNRKDLELTSASAIGVIISDDNYNVDYKFTVTNLSEDTIGHFTVFTNQLSEDFGPLQFVKNDISKVLAPGESYQVEGSFIHYWALASITFNIEGVDFGIDSDMTNNSFTTDIITLSNKESKIKQYSISPNPSANFLILEGEESELVSIMITDIEGRKLKISKEEMKRIDISDLPKGQYWLEIKTRSRLEQHPFIKL